ncbi:unnamed protein product [Arctogadus glacialis]
MRGRERETETKKRETESEGPRRRLLFPCVSLAPRYTPRWKAVLRLSTSHKYLHPSASRFISNDTCAERPSTCSKSYATPRRVANRVCAMRTCQV